MYILNTVQATRGECSHRSRPADCASSPSQWFTSRNKLLGLPPRVQETVYLDLLIRDRLPFPSNGGHDDVERRRSSGWSRQPRARPVSSPQARSQVNAHTLHLMQDDRHLNGLSHPAILSHHRVCHHVLSNLRSRPVDGKRRCHRIPETMRQQAHLFRRAGIFQVHLHDSLNESARRRTLGTTAMYQHQPSTVFTRREEHIGEYSRQTAYLH